MKAKNLKKSQGSRAGRAIAVAPFGASRTKTMAALKPSKLSFRALNNICIIKEDSRAVQEDNDSGLTKNVADALRSGKLFIPEKHEDYANKFPCTGVITSVGSAIKAPEIVVGARVMFARLGVQRVEFKGEVLCLCREDDIHAIFN